jgi:hypothetical protein
MGHRSVRGVARACVRFMKLKDAPEVGMAASRAELDRVAGSAASVTSDLSMVKG